MVKRLIKKILTVIKNIFHLQCTPDNTYKSNITSSYAISKSAVELMKKKYLCLKNTTEPKLFSDCLKDIQFLATKIDSNEKALLKTADDILYTLDKMKYVQDGTDDDTIVYSVIFGGRKNFYYYLGNGTSYKEGQYVIVPVGDSMEEKVAKIHSKFRYTDAQMPLNLRMLKKIITHAI